MKLILATDAIFHPLTGIGRYTWEMAARLPTQPGVEHMHCFKFGRFVPNPTNQQSIDSGQQPVPGTASPGGFAALRATLATIQPVVKLYSALSPHLYKWRLRHHSDHIFHAPNFLLPPFGGPAIATIHDLSTHLYPQYHPAARVALMNTELPRTLKRAHHLITVSEYIRQEIIQHFNWPAQRITAVPLGVDPRFHPRTPQQTQATLQTFGLQHGGYCLCVATIEPRKNIDRLLDAYTALPTHLRARHPLVLAGSPGWNSQALHQRLQSLASKGVQYLHFVTETQLHHLYAGARLFVFPSLYEGFGLPVIEAMSSGIPVVTSTSSSLPEVAGPHALMVNPLDTDQLRTAMQQGLTDEPWRQQASAGGLQRAALATWQGCALNTTAVYRQVIHQG